MERREDGAKFMINFETEAGVFRAAFRTEMEVFPNVLAVSPCAHLILQRAHLALEPKHAMSINMALRSELTSGSVIPGAQRRERRHLEFFHFHPFAFVSLRHDPALRLFAWDRCDSLSAQAMGSVQRDSVPAVTVRSTTWRSWENEP